MANMRRAHNRAVSAAGGGGIPRSSGDYGTKSRSSGSHAHIGERVGPGPVAGAERLDQTNHHGPGRAAKRVRVDNTENPIRGTGRGKSPRGRQDQEDLD